jgi:iron complex outermembrane receptor protein
LPGGDLGFAVGVGARHDGQFVPGQPAALSGNIPGFLTTFINGTESNLNAHAEIDAPIFKWLEVNAAGRFDHYADVGSATTPQVGIKWQPVEWVAIRGTFGRGFRAPGPAERGNSGVEFFQNEGVDPIRCPVTGLPNDCGSGQIAGVNGGNPNLRPERSTQYTVGLVFMPSRNINLAIDWWQIRRTDEIIGGVGTPIIIRGPVQAAYPTVPGPIIEELSPYENIGSDEPKGIDADLTASFNFASAGQLGIEAHFTHLISQFYCDFASGAPGACADVAGTHGPTSISGDTGTPKNRGEATLSWTREPMQVGLLFNYVSGMSDTDPIVALGNGLPLNTCLQSWWPACYTTAWYDFDLFGHYDITHNLQATLHIFNVFNQSAPFDYQAAYGQSNYNMAYAQQGAIGRFFQIGVRYRM